MAPPGDMPSSHPSEPPDSRPTPAGATIGTSGAAGSTPRPLNAMDNSHSNSVRIHDDELLVGSVPLAASAYRQRKRVSIELPGPPPVVRSPSPDPDASPRVRSPSRGASTFVFPMRSVFRGRSSRVPESDSDTSHGDVSNTAATVESDRSTRSSKKSNSSGHSSHLPHDMPRTRNVPGLVDPNRTDTSTFSTIHSMLEFTSKSPALGGVKTSLTPFDNKPSYALGLLPGKAAGPLPPALPSTARPAPTPTQTQTATSSSQRDLLDTPNTVAPPPLGSASDGGTERARSDSSVPLVINAPTPTLPTYPPPQSTGSSIAHVMASTSGTGLTSLSDSPVSGQVTNIEPTPTAIGSGSGSGSRTAVMGSQPATVTRTGGATPQAKHSSTRARLEASRRTVQTFVDDQSTTVNMLDPNAPTPRSGVYVPDAAALRRLAGMDVGVRQGLLTSGAFAADEDDREWAFNGRSTTSMSVRESLQGVSGDDNSSTREPITTVRYEHIDTGDGHHVLTGKEGRILRCEDEPICAPGSVQGFGVLMVLEQRNGGRLSVRQVSENSTELLGLSPRYLFRLDCFTRILTPDQAEILRDKTRWLADAPKSANSSREDLHQVPLEEPPQVFLLSGFGEQGTDDSHPELSASQSYRRREWTCWVAAHRPRVRDWRKHDSKGRELPPPDLIILEFELEHDKYNPLMPEATYASSAGGQQSTRYTSPSTGGDSDVSRSRRQGPHSVPASVIQSSAEAAQSTHSLSPNFKAPTKLRDTSDSGGDSGHSYPETSSSEALATSGSNGPFAPVTNGPVQHTNSILRHSQSPNNHLGKTAPTGDSGESDMPSTQSSGLKSSGHATSSDRPTGSVRFSVAGNIMDDEEYERWVNSTTNYARPLPSLERMRRSGGSSHGSQARHAPPGPRSRVGMLDAFSVLNQINEQLSAANDLDTLFKITVGIMQDLTSFHRIMMYRFDEAYNGEVVAELVDPTKDIDLFNGLWFPSTDIPPQARQLYTVNKVRFLYDRSQTTARLVLKERSDVDYPLDMTHCFLRALSPIHLQYLKNMNVQASLSISVMAFGKLWGLICCHSVGEYGMRASFPVRQLLRILSDTISLNVERLTYAERLSVRRLITSMPNDTPVPGYIMSNADDLLSYFDADAGMLVINDGCKLLGKVEHAHAMLAIAEYLRISKFEGIRTSSCIEIDHPDLILPGSADTGSISGLLYVPLTARAGQDFLVFFRKGQLREVRWAGNPYKPDNAEPDIQLQPRKSFQIWAEKVYGRARPWSEDQIESAGILALIYGKFIQVWRERQNAMVSSQLTAILLSNTSHAVRTPLSQIINTLELALAGNIDDETRAMLENSHQASRALLFHVHDLLDLTRIEPGNETGFNDPFDLKQTMRDTVRLYQTEANRRGLEFRVNMGDDLPAMVIGDARKIKTIVSNLVANSVKFTESGYIEVAARLQQFESAVHRSNRGSSSQDSPPPTDGNFSSADESTSFDSVTGATKAVAPPEGFAAIEIVVSDSGCGIPPDQLEAMFVALEGAEDWTNPEGAGLGLGLAVVARITEQLQGQLCVESEVKTGTSFFLTLNMEIFTGELPAASSSERRDGLSRPDLDDFDIPAIGAGDLLMGVSAANPITSATPLRPPGPETPPSPMSAGVAPSPPNTHRRLAHWGSATVTKHLPLLSPDLMKQGQQTMGTLPSRSSPSSNMMLVTERRLSVGAGSFVVRSSDRSPAVSSDHQQGNYFERRVSNSSPTSTSFRMSMSPQVSPSLDGLPPPIVSPKGFVRTNSTGSSNKSVRGSRKRSSLVGDSAPPSPPQMRSKRGPKGNQQLRVLVVEDDLINSQILQRRLRMDKHTVIAVENGQQAVDALEADWDIDAVLMDIQMPIMDGKTAASEIRKQEAKMNPRRLAGINPLLVDERIPIFAVSASLYEEDRAGLALNFDGWLLKPLDFSRVRELLAALEDTKKRRAEVYSPGHWERGGYFRGETPQITPNGSSPEGV